MKRVKGIQEIILSSSMALLGLLVISVPASAQTDSKAPSTFSAASGIAASKPAAKPVAAAPECNNSNTVIADVVALDQPFMVNRLGAAYPQGMVFALRQDVISIDGNATLRPGKVRLRPDKRPRPITLRVNKDQCLQINLINLVTPDVRSQVLSPITREVSLHVNGLNWVASDGDDGAWVGNNGLSSTSTPPPQPTSLSAAIDATSTAPIPVAGVTGFPTSGIIRIDAEYIQYTGASGNQFTGITRGVQGSTAAPHAVNAQVNLSINRGSLVDVGKTKTYKLYASQVGSFLLYSMGAPLGSIGANDAGQISAGMFGAVNVQPATAEYYRSQVTNKDFNAALQSSTPNRVVNYNARYKTDGQYNPKDPSRSCGAPVLKVVDLQRIEFDENGNGKCKPDPTVNPRLQLYSSDLTAIITGPNADVFKVDPKNPPPEFVEVSASPYRTQPWREVTVIYHEVPSTVQAFKEFYQPPPVTSVKLSSNIAAASTSPIPVADTAAFPSSGTIQIDNEFIWFEGKTDNSLGSATVQRGVDGSTAASHNANVAVNLYIPDLSGVLLPGVDGFAINYGAGGIGAEVLANRINVGPMANCTECKFEEFFLSSWSVGDPAMVVDVPANTPVGAQTNLAQAITSTTSTTPITVQSVTGLPLSGIVRIENEFIQYVGVSGNQIGTVSIARGVSCSTGATHSNGLPVSLYNQTDTPNQETVTDLVKELTCLSANTLKPPNIVWPSDPKPGPKATVAFYPDDPSNVYHSYLNDHVKFQILNVGGGISHVHHQHAHQWLHTPNNTNSSYLDSQMISPGAAFTLEMVYEGSGNRNKTAGDSIFHCHFYPHFAAGMWGMWRVHDVFEEGTKLKDDGLTPLPNTNRVLPDGELATGATIPAIVPIPTIAMAPNPARLQVCPVYDNWTLDSFVGNSCPAPSSSTAPILGYAAVVNKDDIDQKLNPGYPFFIPGIAGHRAPHPPLDFAYEKNADGSKTYHDGGLPRHLIMDGSVVLERHNQWDFTKDNYNSTTKEGYLVAIQLPEAGSQAEQVTMNFMGTRIHGLPGLPLGITPKGVDCALVPSTQPCAYLTNGLPRKPGGPFVAENQYGSQLGAPFADPAVMSDNKYPNQVKAVGDNVRRYKVAVIQNDVAFNKAGSHYPQQRFESLWKDVMPTIKNEKKPEPLFFRANSHEDIIEFWHTNLVPDYYELDDFQVRTPTDILGQHIHLVKFDVLASDGAANGYNYEDGTLSPDDVRHRINALNNTTAPNKGKWIACPTCPPLRAAQPPPALICTGADCRPGWTGAQTTVQRWYPDPLEGCPNGAENCFGLEQEDRTMRTVFTHDHFGPSTHQQAGLYSGLLIEPMGSTWLNSEDGTPLGGGEDGGPTSWQAIINTRNKTGNDDSYREFALEFQDLTLAYKNTSKAAETVYPGENAPRVITTIQTPWGWVDKSNVIAGNNCGTNNTPALKANPCLISSNQGVGTASVNYRNEPLGPNVGGTQFLSRVASNPANTLANDMAFAFSSTARATTPTNLNAQPALGASVCPKGQPGCSTTADSPFRFPGGFMGATGYDPYTPLLRAYQNDKVQVRLLVGAHLFQHSYGMQGLRWLFEPSASTSGWRDNQTMGISEHFELLFTVPYSQQINMTGYNAAPPPPNQIPTQTFLADYLYMAGQGRKDLQNNGIWGMLRAYNVGQAGKLLTDLHPLSNNDPLKAPVVTSDQTCPAGTTARKYNVAAINTPSGSPTDTNALRITYNGRITGSELILGNNAGAAMVYVPANPDGTPVNTGPPTTPLILRANAGECIEVTLYNRINVTKLQGKGAAGNANPSAFVGLHAQLASFDVTQGNGTNVGFNPTQTVPPPNCPTGGTCTFSSRKYVWYAGNIITAQDGTVTRVPVEFGSVNLMAADPMMQPQFAMVGALIIEPEGSTWCSSTNSAKCSGPVPGVMIPDASVDVTYNNGQSFREFVAILQNGLTSAVGWSSVNYGSEPMSYNIQPSTSSPRFGSVPYSNLDLSTAFSNLNPFVFDQNAPSGQCKGDPFTPIFVAEAGTPVRFRMLHPDGVGAFPDSVWTIHGHSWQEEPYVDSCDNPETCPQFTASARLGFNPLSQWMGSRDGFGPGNHFDILIDKAGGAFSVPGDYLYRSYPANREFINGVWGIFRVLPAGQKLVTCPTSAPPPETARAAVRAKAPARGATDVSAGVIPRPTTNGAERFFPEEDAKQQQLQPKGKPKKNQN